MPPKGPPPPVAAGLPRRSCESEPPYSPRPARALLDAGNGLSPSALTLRWTWAQGGSHTCTPAPSLFPSGPGPAQALDDHWPVVGLLPTSNRCPLLLHFSWRAPGLLSCSVYLKLATPSPICVAAGFV